ncbi:hypothetical protein VLK31_02830 [Variovorax sp. H27-G14]|uniref:hypothetical protein n=1 Tax=Variovorax sp. H27-G14 TaxID=3111914 RepID=UPI0038FC2C24
MMIDNILSLRTDPKLLEAARSASKKLNPQEILEQKISFVFGSMGRDSNMTKEQVRRSILEQGGSLTSK